MKLDGAIICAPLARQGEIAISRGRHRGTACRGIFTAAYKKLPYVALRGRSASRHVRLAGCKKI